MGLVLGVEAVVCVVEAVEAGLAAAEAGEAIAGAVDAAEAIGTGAADGATAGTAAGAAAGEAVATGGEALSTIMEMLGQAMKKLGKILIEYAEIDAVFKAAKKILGEIFSDPAAQARFKKLANLIDVLTKCLTLIKDLTNWLKDHSDDTTTLQGIELPLSGILSQFLPKLGAASGVLQSLSKQVAAKNLKKDPVTDGEVEALYHGLDTVAQSFKLLVDFKNKQAAVVKELAGLPIDDAKVVAITSQLAK